MISDAGDGVVRADEHFAGVEDPDLIEVVEEVLVRAFFKPAAKALGGKSGDPGNIFQGDVLVEIVLYVPVYFAEPVGGIFFIVRVVDVVCNAAAVGGGCQDM